jgi:hypothetical protein
MEDSQGTATGGGDASISSNSVLSQDCLKEPLLSKIQYGAVEKYTHFMSRP